MTLNTMFFISLTDKIKASNSKLNKIDMRLRKLNKTNIKQNLKLFVSDTYSYTPSKVKDLNEILAETEEAKRSLYE